MEYVENECTAIVHAASSTACVAAPLLRPFPLHGLLAPPTNHSFIFFLPALTARNGPTGKGEEKGRHA